MPNIEPARKEQVAPPGAEWNRPADPQKIRSLLSSPACLNRIAKVIPKHLTADRLLNVSLNIINAPAKGSARLLDCTPASLMGCIVQLAELGLEPDGVTQYAHLVPFKDGARTLCKVMMGYRGYIELARRSGELETIPEAHVVYEKDKLDLVYGFNPKFEYIPYFQGDPGQPYLAICYAVFSGGKHSVFHMTKNAIYAIREKSESYRYAVKQGKSSTPWISDELSMWKKTVIKQAASKYWPLSKELERAIEIDNDDEKDGNIVEGVLSARPFEVIKPKDEEEEPQSFIESEPEDAEVTREPEPEPEQEAPATEPEPVEGEVMDPVTELRQKIGKAPDRDTLDALQVEANSNRGAMSEAEWASIRDALKKRKAELQ